MVNSVNYHQILHRLKFLGFAFVLALSFSVPSALSLEGRVKKSEKSTKKNRKRSSGKNNSGSNNYIQGGIKDEAVLNPSLKVLPGHARRSKGAGFDGNVVQYAGSDMYSPGGPMPRLKRRSRSPMFPSRKRRRSHRIPTITDYTLTPRNGIMTFGGHGVIVSPSHKGITSIRRGSGVSIPRSKKGVTVFSPAYEVSRAPSSTSSMSRHHHSSYRIHGRHGSNKGISVWAPGLASIYDLSSRSNSIQTRHGVTAWTPGYEVGTLPVSGRDYAYTPGSSTHKIASKNGVTAWTPGYEVTVNAGGGYKTSLGGKWYEPQSNPSGKVVALRAKPGGVMMDPIFAQPVLEGPLLAKADLLPQLKATSIADNITWKDWYHTVASAIYSRWKNFEVGAGTAKVHVVVTRGREISAEVQDFYPAPYVDRDINEETEFRVAALKAVRSVEQYEIPSFPPLSIKDEVQFNVMLKRTVDGPIGIDISKL